jgi:uncharacterized protein (UPF0332 family)
MTLKQWADNGWLKRHQSSAEEIGNLFAIVERDLNDAAEGTVSDDWRFGIAYNANLKLCTVLLYAEGYKAERTLQHYRTIQALALVLGSDKQKDVRYMDACRAKRNIVEYDYVGSVTKNDADELIAFAKELKDEVETWFEERHPELA